MPTSSDDTIPHAPRPLADVPSGTTDPAEAVRGDTVMREPLGRPAEAPTPAPLAPSAAPVPAQPPAPLGLPPVPASLRAHHRIRVGGGEPIDLDRTVRIGRRPRAGRVPQPATPRLIEVTSPDGGISAMHLELREEGVAVVATDMRTLNGSEVRVPGSPVRTLLRGESVVVTPGTRIDLGEGVVVEILAPAREERVL